MESKQELREWVVETFPTLSDAEVNEYCEDYSELIDWWVAVMVESSLEECESESN